MTPHRKPTKAGMQLRELILRLASQPEGFETGDAADLPVTYSNVQLVCKWFVRDSMLFVARVKGIKELRYFATAEAANAWKVNTPPFVYKRHNKWMAISQPKTVEGKLARNLILVAAASSDGFRPSEGLGFYGPESCSGLCKAMANVGELFCVIVSRGAKVYFTSQTMATSCAAAYERQRPKSKKQAQTKTRKVSDYMPRSHKGLAPKPKDTAERVYPPGYKLTIIPTPPPRFEARSCSFVHNGY